MKWWLRLLLAISICLPALGPFFKSQFFSLHDWTHAARLYEMDQGLKDGHFPVRWAKDLGFGYGLPQFNFYAPLFYYLAELVYGWGVPALVSIKLVVIANFIAAFLAMEYWGRKMFNQYVGLTAATAFIYIPYRAVNTYVRGALAELTAITLLAITLALLVRWQQRRSWANTAWIALAWAGIWTAHNLIGMISFPLVIMTLIGVWLSDRSGVKAIKQMVCMVGLSLGIAAFYLLPMGLEHQYTMAFGLTTGFSDFHHHFLYLRQLINSAWGYGGSIFGVNDGLSFRIGNLHLALTGVTLLMLSKRRWLKRQQQGWLWISLLAVVLAILMSTFKTQFIWERVSFLKFVQFPWRYLAIVMTYGSMLTGAAIYWTYKLSRFKQTLVTVMAGLGLIVLNLQYFKPEKFLTDNETLYYTDPQRIAREMSRIIPDFISRHEAEVVPPPPSRRFSLEDKADLAVEIDRTQEFSLRIKSATEQMLTINILYFPGWKLYLDGQETGFHLNQGWPTMRLMVPASEEPVLISGKFGEAPIRVIANSLTILALGVSAYLILRQHDPIRKHQA